MTELKTDFSLFPFFDDYKTPVNGGEDKNYYRILFRPATAVQARELNQLQSMVQEQISRHSDYVFKDGAIVDGCAITYLPKFDFVRVLDEYTDGSVALLSGLPTNCIITNGLTADAVRAEPVIFKDGYELQYPDTNRIYLNYIYTGRDAFGNEVSSFGSNETLYIFNENQEKLGTLDINNLVQSIQTITSSATVDTVGQGYGIRVSDGVIYQKGHFINVNMHVITVKEYDTDPNGYVVGFQTEESIITPELDSYLYDNALGYPNVKAPGAYRLKLEPELVAMTRTSVSTNSNFFAIVEFDSNQPTEQNKGEEGLNRLLDQIAKRTAEESGNYVVKPFSIELSPISANTTHFNYNISSGIVYVNGYRKEKGPGTTQTPAPIANDFRLNNAQTISGNYGNYVIVEEAVGVFNFDGVKTVDLYDTKQKSISDFEGVGTAPSGLKIGTASIINFQHDNGNKGAANCQYRLYLTNVNMNANRRFADVRSFVLPTTDTFGGAKADSVLIKGETQIQDGSRNVLVFPTGLDAVKQLRDNAGVTSDTQFIFRDITSDTISTNGLVTFTINLPTNGGVERLVDSIGTLSNTRELTYNIVLSNEAHTSALAGTVSINANANTQLVDIDGVGTTFTQHFVAGDIINISPAFNSTLSAKIVSVDSDAKLTVMKGNLITGTVGVAYRKYYPKGHVVNLAQFGGTINVISSNQFTVDTKLNLGGTLNATQTVYAEYQVQRSSAIEMKKEIRKNRFVRISGLNPGLTSGTFGLGLVDVAKIRGIYVGTGFATTNPERSSWFTFDNGQRDSFYDHASITVKPQFKSKITAATDILVELDYFVVNTVPGVGFSSIDSYPINDVTYLTDATKIHTAEVPRYFSKIYNSYIDLRNAIDFRPRKTNISADAILPDNSATLNPVNTSTAVFDVPATGQFILDADTQFQCDIEYYIPRVDLICMNKEGDVIIRSGEPDIIPLEPKNEQDTAILARIDVKPYPTVGTREAVTFNRKDLASKVTNRIIKRYTMDDIGALEKRIERMEYYTTLNLLEQKAKDMVIPDANGLDRFKNGIFADTFNSHLLGKVQDIEYKCAVDRDKSLARPLFETYDIDTQFDSVNSTNIKQTGPYLTLPFTDDLFIQQKYATKFRNCCESIWQWNGKINLYPSYDHFRDEVAAPAINNTLDLSAPWEEFAESPFGTNFGDWRVTGTSTRSTSQTLDAGRITQRNVNSNGRGSGTRTSTVATQVTTTTSSERIISNLNVDTTSDNINLGTFVTDFSISPYMRSRNVAFVVTGLKPNTVMHAFFDSVNVDQFCAPGVLSGITNVEAGKEDTIVTKTGAFGDALVTDSSGNLYGIFNIPAEQFRIGDREFVVSTVTDLVTGADAQISKAVAQFTASNISVTKQTSTLTTIQPVLNVSSRTQTQIQSSTTTQIRQTSEFVQLDPIAQSFKVIVPESASGMFATGIGVYFQSKNPTLGVTMFLMEVAVGYPDSSRILGECHLDASQVTVSNDASVETVFNFSFPVFLNNNTEYAYMIVPDGSNPDYNIWVAEVGGQDITTKSQVFTWPYTGVMFVSSNANAWTALQKEDIKFNVYRADFAAGTGTAQFQNESDEFFTINGFTLATTGVIPRVGDAVVKKVAGTTMLDTANTNYAYGYVQYYNSVDSELYLDSSTGNFQAGDIIEVHRPVSQSLSTAPGALNVSTLIATTTIMSVDNIEYHAVVPRFLTMEPAQTSVTFKFRGTSSGGALDANYNSVINDYEFEDFIDVHNAFSKSNEFGGKTTFFQATLTSSSKFMSPVVDLRRKSSLLIKNKINNDASNEYLRTGNALSKYVSKNTVLDDKIGNAEDMIALVGAYRPAGTDIEVYVKVFGSDDNDTFDEKLWTKMTLREGNENLYSSPFDVTDYREYEFVLPYPTSLGSFIGDGVESTYSTRNILGTAALPNTNIKITVNGVMQTRGTDYTIVSNTDFTFVVPPAAGSIIEVLEYTGIVEFTPNPATPTNIQSTVYLNNGKAEYQRRDGGVVSGINTYCFKIVMLSDSGNKVPRLADFRSISLQR